LHGLTIRHTELGRQAAPGPYIATLCAGQAIAARGTDAARKTWLPRIVAGEIRAAIPASLSAGRNDSLSAGLTLSGTGVSGTLRCLGCPDAAFVLAPAGEAWVIVELAEAAEATTAAAPLWDRTRETINIRLRDAKPAAILQDATGVATALLQAMTLAISADSAGDLRESMSRFAQGEPVERIRLEATLGQAGKACAVTQAVREFEFPQDAMPLLAALRR
jgi:acyl-CoA dehydrogenase